MKKIKKAAPSFCKNTIFEGNNYIGRFSRVLYSRIGEGSYIGSNCIFVKTKVGRYCSIGSNVSIVFGTHPTKKFVSTHPAFYSKSNPVGLSFSPKVLFEEYKYVDVDKTFYCNIENDVWIGNNVSILQGVTIGNGAIVATGAVVTENVMPYEIVGGIPAKKIGERFNKDEVEFIENLEWWNKGESWNKENIELFSDIGLMKGSLK